MKDKIEKREKVWETTNDVNSRDNILQTGTRTRKRQKIKNDSIQINDINFKNP